ncbi:MAG: hypothetical protein H8Z69_03905 [Nanohaloarchaea archaeon]|nr:hypothetical protein [Candidatus Nanohaloarchaea archaeon]
MSDVLSGDKLEEHKVLISRILREVLKSDNNDLYAYENAGLLDPEALEYLSKFERYNDSDYTKDERYRTVLKRNTSKNINEAIREGDIHRMAHAIGLSTGDKKTDYRKIEDDFKPFIAQEGKIYYISGNPNSGKTNLALFMAELWREEVGGDVASNISSVKAFRTVESFKELKSFFEEPGEKFFIADDFSNHASGYSGDRQKFEQKIRKTTNFIAKYKASLAFIGHTGMDLHADARRKARFLDKKNKTHVDVFKGVKNGQGTNKKMTLESIPETKHGYDPYEKTKWDWNIEEDGTDEKEIRKEINERIKKLALQKNTIKRSDDLGEYKTRLAKLEMRDFAEDSSDWRFKTSPQRLEKRRI